MDDRDVVCFSHLRWNFVFQRPNHLMVRFARQGRVLFVEEPVFHPSSAQLVQSVVAPNVTRVIPHLPEGTSPDEATSTVRSLLAELCSQLRIDNAIHWFYTPLMLPLADGLSAGLTVYDCMDELANFHFAPPELIERERELFSRADVVFTGGMALYEAKRTKHRNVHGVPSSVDVPFFQQARQPQPDPAPQASIAHPRAGYCGVIDERLDLELLAELARARPALQIVMIGPVVKIDPATLPKLPNVHYLGGKSYDELPSYMAGWDVAIMPFALNEATRFISPTKTPEYLAAGKRVVSTAITDVVEPYERLGLVRIGRSASEFVAQIDAALQDDGSRDAERDHFLAGTSWDATWERMQRAIDEAQRARREPAAVRSSEPSSSASQNADH
jgi:glycosyltransferase involved in cell wall biosynthesis